MRVFESLSERPLSSKEIARLTSLSERTVRYALRILKQ
ncbi:MAG TPA: ArsR family transcriptional regulator, partial [Thermococcus paralvinellae]|nr:ArsR family transcriptional regulator [Thermococcus paralvinellae]